MTGQYIVKILSELYRPNGTRHNFLMRISVIDLGTNSIRFAIYDCPNLRGPKKLVHKQKIMLRPGRGVFTSGRLQRPVMNRIIRAIQKFSIEASLRHCDDLGAFATSALREAENARTLLQEVKARTGVQIEVISGKTEAELIARGILQSDTNLQGRFALVDIGGGSTEISLCERRQVVSSVSLRLGAVRLQQLFLPQTLRPIKSEDRQRRVSLMRRHIRQHLLRHQKALTRIHVHRAIGSSGSIRALSKVISKSVNHRYFLPVRLRVEDPRPHFSRSALSHLIELITPLRISEIKALPGLEAKRSDLILPAAILLEEIMLFLGVTDVQTTDFSLRDGLVLHVLDQWRGNSPRQWRSKRKRT